MNLYFENKDTKIYNDDNLDVLKGLADNSINLIYCDILYNTGKKFDDYDDDLGTPLEAMEWYRPRIEQMKRVLAEDGSIYIHCNWRIDSYIRVLMDEIFGMKNFRNRIYRKHSDTRVFYENYDSQMDVIFYYVKDRYNFTFNKMLGSKLYVVPLVENGIVHNHSYRVIYKNEATGKVFDFNPYELTKHWLVSTKEIVEMFNRDEIVFIDGLPCAKTYEIPIGNLWDEDNMLDAYKRDRKSMVYDTPKPEAVLERVITVSSNEGEIVADFFLGGGTTAVVTKKLNRKGIFCDISEKACKVTIQKLSDIK